jgi:acetyl-CoA/propionyl-CoA carboxylase
LLRKILVANRGEIAVRVLRTCKALGLKTAVIYSDADVGALHVRLADEAYRIGPPPASESYLSIGNIIEAARAHGVDGIHPGYGFLAENSKFAQECERNSIIFIGPGSRSLKITGDKLQSKIIARRHGVPVVPGTTEATEDVGEALKTANELGYPVLLKSIFGGGGRGIREVRSKGQMRDSFKRALSEGKAAFGRAGVYIEKVISPARHIEFQILSDGRGRIAHLGERECSIQRRHQKLIELTPSPILDDRERETLGKYAIQVAEGVGYSNAGTVEFLRDARGKFYFIEVNSRLQVEHPITELVTGLDLVQEQLMISSGKSSFPSTKKVQHNGAAIECRINAEDPLSEFTPSVGRVDNLVNPGGPGIRLDTALYQGYRVPQFYDSLVAKLASWGEDLDQARRRLILALDEFQITGLRTTIPLHREVLSTNAFVHWQLRTDFLERYKIIESLARKSQVVTKQNSEMGVAIASVLIAKGVHKAINLGQSDSKPAWAASVTDEEARFFDAV